MTRARSAVAATLLLVSSTPAFAQMLNDRGPPLHRVVHRQTLGARVNPLGLLYEGRFMYRLRLYEAESVTWRDNFIGVGLTPILSPAFIRIGPYVEIAPTSFLTFWGSFTAVQYFGNFDMFQSFPSASVNFSDRQLAREGRERAVGDPLRNYPAFGTELTLGIDLNLRFADKFLVRSRARLIRSDMSMRAGDQVFYEQYYDTLAPNSGWYGTNDFDLGYQMFDRRLTLGVRYTATWQFYTADDFGGLTPVDNSMHRVGPLVAWTFWSTDGRTLNNPTVFLVAQWWAKNRWRNGGGPDFVTSALPLISIGVSVTGDFLPL